MGLTFRKSLNWGPVRINLSRSGIGASVGGNGFRLGVNQTRNYVHIGRAGIQYRATFPSSQSQNKGNSVQPQPSPSHTTVEELKEIESADISYMLDSSSANLLDELNKKWRRIRLWPILLGSLLGMLLLILFADIQSIYFYAVLLLGTPLIFLAHHNDTKAKSSSLIYNIDKEYEQLYSNLQLSLHKLSLSSKIWHISATGKVLDRKYHAGAGQVVERKDTFLKKRTPQYIKTNVIPFSLGVGRQILYFFPDRLLVYSYDGIGAINYKDIKMTISETRFAESEGVPKDSRVVGQTWRYVNKNGSPDRRFNNNTALPVCLYEDIHFSSATGLNELIEVSRCGGGDNVKLSIGSLAAYLEPKE